MKTGTWTPDQMATRMARFAAVGAHIVERFDAGVTQRFEDVPGWHVKAGVAE